MSSLLPSSLLPLPPVLASGNLLRVVVSGDAAGTAATGGPYATFAVLVDGVQVGTTHQVTASHAKNQWQTFDIAIPDSLVSPDGIGDVSIKYLNDWKFGTADRNLYVDEIRIGNALMQAEEGTVHWASGKVSGGQSALTSDATLTFDVGGPVAGPSKSMAPPSETLKLVVASDYAGSAANGGPEAKFEVLINGEVTGTYAASADHKAGQWQTVTVDLGGYASVDTVDVRFVNDWANWRPGVGIVNGEDRNLHVRQIEIEGTIIGADAGVFHSTSGATKAGNETLWSNGTLSFDLDTLLSRTES